MKENAWNKSRITPTITNFLVLMFSIIAPAMANKTGWSGKYCDCERKQSLMLVVGGGKKKCSQSVEEEKEGGDESVASTAGRE